MNNNTDIFKKALLVAIGATAVTFEKVYSYIDELVEKGEMSKEQALKFKEEIKTKAITEKEALENKIQETVNKAISKVIKEMGLATIKDLEDLEKRLTKKDEDTTEEESCTECNCSD